MDWWARLYTWQILSWSVVGALGTVLLVEPGERTVNLAGFHVDPFASLLLLFGGLIAWAGLDLWRSYSTTGQQ